jgi:hypothetical protein
MSHRSPVKKEKPNNPWTKPQKAVLVIIVALVIAAVVLIYVGGIV